MSSKLKELRKDVKSLVLKSIEMINKSAVKFSYPQVKLVDFTLTYAKYAYVTLEINSQNSRKIVNCETMSGYFYCWFLGEEYIVRKSMVLLKILQLYLQAIKEGQIEDYTTRFDIFLISGKSLEIGMSASSDYLIYAKLYDRGDKELLKVKIKDNLDDLFALLVFAEEV